MATILTLDALIAHYNLNTKSRKQDREERGEVFTPLDIVNLFLDKVAAEYTRDHGSNIYENPHLTWFEPSAGKGHFVVQIYARLMSGLAQVILDEEERRRWIVQRMLYMSELGDENVQTLRTVLCGNRYTLNIHHGDTLEMPVSTKYDVVIGNPPYNSGGMIAQRHSTTHGRGTYKALHMPFITRSVVDWCKPEGYVALIVPTRWMAKPDHPMRHTQIRWVEIWNNQFTKTRIEALLPLTLFVLRNTPNTEKMETHLCYYHDTFTTESRMYLDPSELIPLAHSPALMKLQRFIKRHGIEVKMKHSPPSIRGLVKRPMSTVDDPFDGTWAAAGYCIKRGVLVVQTPTPTRCAGDRKIIIPSSRMFQGAFTDNGRMGVSGPYYITNVDNTDILLKVLGFRIMAAVTVATHYNMQLMHAGTTSPFIPDLGKLGITDITEEAFYDLIGLTEEERASL